MYLFVPFVHFLKLLTMYLCFLSLGLNMYYFCTFLCFQTELYVYFLYTFLLLAVFMCQRDYLFNIIYIVVNMFMSVNLSERFLFQCIGDTFLCTYFVLFLHVKQSICVPKMYLICILNIPTFYRNVPNMYLQYTPNVLSSLHKDMP